MDTIVLKFGGTSVADNEKLNTVANKITTLVDEGKNVVVVVSAQGKKTDSLLNEAYELSVCPDKRELDVLLSTGEQVSIAKLSILLNNLGYKAISLTGWQAGIYTNTNNQNAIIEHIDVTRIKKELSQNKIVIIAGFQGINEYLDITTLGRGGSDTTAISIASALNSDGCYIYSDVEGIFTADPRKVNTAKKIEKLSYDEMIDIANEGAKVLHNRCVVIGKKFNIPIIAKSTFKEDNGSIVNNCIEDQSIKSLVKNDDLVEVYISNKHISYVDFHKCMIDNKITPIELSNYDDNIYALFKLNDSKKLDYIMDGKLSYEIMLKRQITRISIIGHEISNNTLILKLVYNLLSSEAESIKTIDYTCSKIRITFKCVMGNEFFKELHDKIFEQ